MRRYCWHLVADGILHFPQAWRVLWIRQESVMFLMVLRWALLPTHVVVAKITKSGYYSHKFWGITSRWRPQHLEDSEYVVTSSILPGNYCEIDECSIIQGITSQYLGCVNFIDWKLGCHCWEDFVKTCPPGNIMQRTHLPEPNNNQFLLIRSFPHIAKISNALPEYCFRYWQWPKVV